MGLQDRDYNREYSDDESWRGPRPKKPVALTTILILICVTVSVADLLTSRSAPPSERNIIVKAESEGPITVQDERAHSISFNPVKGRMELSTFPSELPLRLYTFLTYGFAHQPINDGARGLLHLFGNMVALYFIGNICENLLGRMEFLRFYLGAVIFAGLVYFLIGVALQQRSTVVGASGAIAACVIFTAWRIPHERVSLMGAAEVPMWGLGVGYVAIDILGAFGRGDSTIAFTCHLGGALFATLYHQLGLNFEFLDFSRWGTWRRQASTLRKLKVHSEEGSEIENLADEADRLLTKINEKGQASLTKRERELLERYSREVQNKRARR